MEIETRFEHPMILGYQVKGRNHALMNVVRSSQTRCISDLVIRGINVNPRPALRFRQRSHRRGDA